MAARHIRHAARHICFRRRSSRWCEALWQHTFGAFQATVSQWSGRHLPQGIVDRHAVRSDRTGEEIQVQTIQDGRRVRTVAAGDVWQFRTDDEGHQAGGSGIHTVEPPSEPRTGRQVFNYISDGRRGNIHRRVHDKRRDCTSSPCKGIEQESSGQHDATDGGPRCVSVIMS